MISFGRLLAGSSFARFRTALQPIEWQTTASGILSRRRPCMWFRYETGYPFRVSSYPIQAIGPGGIYMPSPLIRATEACAGAQKKTAPARAEAAKSRSIEHLLNALRLGAKTT